MALKIKAFGKDIIVDLYTKHGYRVSPGANNRARAVAKCARGKDLAGRKECFAGSKGIKG